MQRDDIEFKAAGTTLRGWLYRPASAAAAGAPVVVMAHGYSAVKEMYLDAYAEVFAQAGLAVLAYDHRNFGASAGEPRQEIDPVQQIRDWRDAITWVGQQPGIDAGRVGVWGSSYAGGHALVLGAIDRRVKCVVAQLPLISGHHNARRLTRADLFAPTQAAFEADRLQRYNGGAPMTMPVVSNDPSAPCALPTADAWAWFSDTARMRAPAWRNEVTLRSIELYTEYEPGAYIGWISPTPLLMLVAAQDHVTVADLALDAFEQAREPKRLELLRGGHFDAYTGAGFERSSAAAAEWFGRYLRV